MNSLSSTTPTVNLHAADWQARQVAELALHSLRQPGGIAPLNGNLRTWSYRPYHYDGSLDDRTRIWVIENGEGRILAEEPSLYKAIHKIAE